MPAVYTLMTLELSRWVGALEPVWTLLGPDSVQALSAEPSPHNRALRLAPDIDDEALGNSVLVRNAGIFLKEIAGGETFWISGTSGWLMMKCVTRLRGLMAWPGLEATEHFRKGKTYREQAVKELHLLRLLVEGAGLIRPAGLWFELTPLGQRMLEPGQRGALQAVLFRHTFWHLDLSKFLPVYFPGELPAWWPQGQIGVILWGLSTVAKDWQSADTLTLLSAAADEATADLPLSWGSSMFMWRILWPLHWFGLLECRQMEDSFDIVWRKRALFDRFLSFDVKVNDNRGSGH